MKCPHCSIEIHPAFVPTVLNNNQPIGKEGRFDTSWRALHMACPACHKAIVRLNKVWIEGNGAKVKAVNAYPETDNLRTAPPEVPIELSEDYNEACAVLTDSPKASAALSRRCLQQLLKLHGFTQKDLAKAIEAALASKTLPAALARNVDAIRNIGNFAAHPIKDTSSGQIVEVEPEEADWNLDVLAGLFDFYYVQPAQDQARIDALNVKLLAAGKPPMKA